MTLLDVWKHLEFLFTVRYSRKSTARYLTRPLSAAQDVLGWNSSTEKCFLGAYEVDHQLRAVKTRHMMRFENCPAAPPLETCLIASPRHTNTHTYTLNHSIYHFHGVFRCLSLRHVVSRTHMHAHTPTHTAHSNMQITCETCSCSCLLRCFISNCHAETAGRALWVKK